jgi:hypothetical protein
MAEIVLSTQYSVLSTQYSALSTQHSVLSTQLSTQLITHHFFLCPTKQSSVLKSMRNC